MLEELNELGELYKKLRSFNSKMTKAELLKELDV